MGKEMGQRPTCIRSDFALSEARKLRKRLNLHTRPIDMEWVVKSQGIMLEYSFDISCPTTAMVGGKYIIFISPSLQEKVDRWSICHEFARIVLGHYDYPVDRIFKGVYMPFLTRKERYFLEREAHIFTTEFLTPENRETLCKYPATDKHANKVGRRFRISREAMDKALRCLILGRDKEFVERRLYLVPSGKKQGSGNNR